MPDPRDKPDPQDKPLPVRPDEVLPAGDDPAGEPSEDVIKGLDLGGGAGGLDLGGLLDMAGQMQQKLVQAHEQAQSAEVEGVAGGGVVRIRVNGAGDFRSVDISAEVVDPDDVEMLQDLVLAALHDAMAQVHELQHDTLGGAHGLPGLGDLGDLGGLGGLLGGQG